MKFIIANILYVGTVRSKMPVYQYQCERCGAVDELELHMKDSKPKAMSCNGCQGIMWRRFTIPGLFVADVDEWVVRVPGEVQRERRDMAWRRKYRPEIYDSDHEAYS